MAGGAYQDEEAGGMISDINVTPLVDVTLVLLIIFMVTAQLIVEKDRGITIERPKTAAGEEVPSQLIVTIDADRVLHVDYQPYTNMDAAKAVISDKAALNPEIKAVIAADVNVPHGDVMKVIDLVKAADITRFALASDPLSVKKEGDGDD